MAKRIITLTDEEIDRVLEWFEAADTEGAVDEDDEAVAETFREARLA